MSMHCTVWRSGKKTGAYLYLAEKQAWEDLPVELQQLLGKCEQVMQLDLNQRNRLASENIDTVKANLQSQGFYLQMPPQGATKVIEYGSR